MFQKHKRNTLLNAVYKNQLSLGRMQTHSCCTRDWDQGLIIVSWQDTQKTSRLAWMWLNWTTWSSHRRKEKAGGVIQYPETAALPSKAKQTCSTKAEQGAKMRLHFIWKHSLQVVQIIPKVHQSWSEKQRNSCHSLCTVESKRHEEGESAHKRWQVSLEDSALQGKNGANNLLLETRQ